MSNIPYQKIVLLISYHPPLFSLIFLENLALVNCLEDLTSDAERCLDFCALQSIGDHDAVTIQLV